MELSGSLKRFSVSNVFQLLNMERSTGKLTLRRRRRRITITMRAGDVLDVEHSGVPKINRMFEILLEGGRITKAEWDDILEEQKSRLVSLGSILREKARITSQDFVKLALLVYTDILFEALSWREGVYDFKRLDRVESEELSEPMSMQTILLNAAQVEDEWPQIRRYIPSSDMIFTPTPEDVVGWEGALKSMPPDDRKIADLIDGTRSVSRISSELIRSEYEVSRLLMDLARRGLITRVLRPLGEELPAKRFFSFRIGPAAVVPYLLVFGLVLVLHLWKNYLAPVWDEPEPLARPLAYGGRDETTINRLRLHRLRDAMQLYQMDRGSLPSSLEILKEEGYCGAQDLRTTWGGEFVFKLIGAKEERAILQVAGVDGKTGPDLTLEIVTQ